MTGDLAHAVVRMFVRPHSVDASVPAGGDAEIAAVALIRAIGGVVCCLQQGHVGVLAWNIDDRGIAGFFQIEGAIAFGDHLASYGDDNMVAVRRDGDRMIGAGNSDGFVGHLLHLLYRAA